MPAVTIRHAPQPAATTGRRRRTPLTALAARLTPRDLWLLDMLAEHTVLTTHHITALAFTGRRSANRRLHALHQLGLLDSFRIRQPIGSGPEHYVLGHLGAQVLAARHATTPQALGWHTDQAGRVAYHPELAHDTGATGFLADYAADGQLDAWWGPARCARAWGDLARPDAYARHVPTSDKGEAVGFFLEYDTGTEPLTRLAAKLDDYAELARATATRPLVLFTLHSHRREAHLHQRLAGHPALTDITVATSSRDTHDSAPDAAWLPVALPSHRAPLTELARLWPDSPVTDPGQAVSDTHLLPAPTPLPPKDVDAQPLLRNT
ncbi:replication-relaxation family protein [Streptacidiphilus monticola]|uniref:Replication-relaxation family protein n=1 Tax=Streptacidiphilus monticola TaxID=2161674 RepID=A0ABW1FZK0_9ACTN